ncbi:MAG: hypothetical protein SVT52_07290 [Planctomycetota bacterium]|nr:hypothetical protein [Planctomycetota bacterium]
MNTPADKKERSALMKALSWCRVERHFLAAAMVLAVTAAGWGLAKRFLKWVMHKEPVPWPANVVIDDGFRLLNFPNKLGPYVLAADGELEGKLDGKPDGQTTLRPDVMESLKIGTALDKERIGERQSNWHMVRTYRDSRVTVPSAYKYWRLELYYYTGGLDTVPHVPERCLVAGGARLISVKTIRFSIPAARKPWDKPINFKVARYEVSDQRQMETRQYVQYYVFSLNGEPEDSWEKVRLALTNPFMRHCYFAKIQFAPLGEVTDPEEVRKSAEDFLNTILPSALQALPMPDYMQRLRKTKDTTR